MAEYVRRRVAVSAAAGGADPAADASDWAAYYPALAEWMTLTVLDGKPRQTASLLLFVEGDSWKVRIANRDEDEQAFLSGRSLTQLMDSLEAGLVNGTLDWRKVQPFKGGKGK